MDALVPLSRCFIPDLRRVVIGNWLILYDLVSRLFFAVNGILFAIIMQPCSLGKSDRC